MTLRSGKTGAEKGPAIRPTFWSTCRIAGGRTWFWVAFWTGNPLNDDREPDAIGKARARDLAEAAAREAIRGAQPDWRFQIADTVPSLAAAHAVIAGHKVFTPKPPKAKLWDDPAWQAQRDEEVRRNREAFFREHGCDVDEWIRRHAGEARARWAAMQGTAVRTDPFAELGITSSATADEVKRAFRRKAFDAHPDRGGTHEAFVRLEGAYRAAMARTNTQGSH